MIARILTLLRCQVTNMFMLSTRLLGPMSLSIRYAHACLPDEAEMKKRATDPMYNLEHKLLDKRKADEAIERLDELQVTTIMRDRTWNYHTRYSLEHYNCHL